ncbi:hypothetical protein GCM10023187_26510 [Nibrella viscosa]|uniref:Alpha-L-fucosidase 2 n=1 Tax=Nibrella viscosa TaxID=1084524 RepID=A0ABP8KGP9_9BACT
MQFKKAVISSLFCVSTLVGVAQPVPAYNLAGSHLPTRWDEGLPLGNGMVGSLIWKKGDSLRFSLDRVDLWDQRPMKGLFRPEFTYQWVYRQVQKNEYKIVQDYFDAPYDREPAPTKIPGAALAFAIQQDASQVQLDIRTAQAQVTWPNGMQLRSFVHATHPVGWFQLIGAPKEVLPTIIPPAYQTGKPEENPNSLDGDNLIRLGYPQGTVIREANRMAYHQPGWEAFAYDVEVQWQRRGDTLTGVWSISTNQQPITARQYAQAAWKRGIAADRQTHQRWWNAFWAKSSLQVPDDTLTRQWYLEQYKFGAAARKGAPAISLQAVWTADDGRIPPWKGDYHHDLNTQLSYWPAYSGNHMDEAEGYIDFLERCRPEFERFTRHYFQVNGLAVPGVTTLDGTAMGGWIQYSCSPTTAAWLAQHYYWQWRYTMDRQFLKNKAYPWFRDVATMLENVTVKDGHGSRKLPISASPEINNNKITAWFHQMTNYDLALCRYVFQYAAELAGELGNKADAARWRTILAEFPAYALSENAELKFAPSLPYKESHRHFSHLMAIHPLGLIKWEDGPQAQNIIRNSIALLEKIGPGLWCGYSWSWLGNLKARAKDGAGAADALKIFARAFCSPNSFHLNGDQTKSGYSTFTYRPFTLEGNFAYAAGLQEMLLQSYAGFVEVFPAIPATWTRVRFDNLRAEGAFLISARRTPGVPDQVTITSEKGGTTQMKLPGKNYTVVSSQQANVTKGDEGFIRIRLQPGGMAKVVLNR